MTQTQFHFESWEFFDEEGWANIPSILNSLKSHDNDEAKVLPLLCPLHLSLQT